MGEFSPVHWLIVLAIIVVLFGGGKFPPLWRHLGITSGRDLAGDRQPIQSLSQVQWKPRVALSLQVRKIRDPNLCCVAAPSRVCDNSGLKIAMHLS